jgi:hypothetical protein
MLFQRKREENAYLRSVSLHVQQKGSLQKLQDLYPFDEEKIHGGGVENA